MRRSSAPSFRQNVTEQKEQRKQSELFPNALRSTDNILNLLEPDREGVQDHVSASSNEHHLKVSEENSYPVNNARGSSSCARSEVNEELSNHKRIFNVVWGKRSTKKHKTWEGDGVLEVGQKIIILKDMEGKILGQSTHLKIPSFEEGSNLFVGSKEVEIVSVAMPEMKDESAKNSMERKNEEQRTLKTLPAKKRKIPSSFITPAPKMQRHSTIGNSDPLVMPAPSPQHQWEHNKAFRPVSDVAVDPCLVRVLRPHQRTGIIFLYECVMGMRRSNYYGAILADEMGLGKTLQCISLVWTLLKKGPYGGCPVLHKVLIVTPSSVVLNWQKEFFAWLGRERISIFVVDQKNKPKDYKKVTKEPIMLISYEMFVRYYEDVKEFHFDLIICDEGHRLKNNSIKASTLLTKINCKRKILLTGTPVQNDLQEFYALVDFVNPGVFVSNSEFHKYFEEPIVASRQPNAEKETKRLGEERVMELNLCTKWFILRRTQEVINKYLPSKQESVIFCQMTPLQKDVYRAAISYWENREERTCDNVAHLSVIMVLKKICNHPALIFDNSRSDDTINISTYLNQKFHIPHSFSATLCGKLAVLVKFLENLSRTKEKVVIVSNYTQTLDIMANVCNQFQYKYCRLDGSTPSNQRQKIVDAFNSKHSPSFVFLLSARAGGIGLNLTGASRLILYDSDWNPATDLQAMSRIWRDGQSRIVHIYRLLTTGSIEEKIFQRQVSKTGLSGAVVDSQSGFDIRLSKEELKDLFTLHDGVECLTHDLLKCKCNGEGKAPGNPEEEVQIQEELPPHNFLLLKTHSEGKVKLHMNQLFDWEHHGQPFKREVLQDMGIDEASNTITYIFRNILRMESPDT